MAKQKSKDLAKLSRRYAAVYKAVADLAATLEDLEDEDDNIVAPNRALTISFNRYPQALKIEGWGKKFAQRLDDYDG